MPSRRGTFPNTDSAGKLSSTGDTTTDSPRTLPARRGTLTTNDQPRPLPPKLKKKEFLKNINFADIDYIVSEVTYIKHFFMSNKISFSVSYQSFKAKFDVPAGQSEIRLNSHFLKISLIFNGS